MPNYRADLDWLEQTHPDIFATIPAELLNDPEIRQIHCSVYEQDVNSDGIAADDDIVSIDDCTTARTIDRTTEDGGIWCIIFMRLGTDTDVDQPDERELPSIILGIPRPDPENPELDYCQYHTLRCSREFCPEHSNHKLQLPRQTH